jgi:hypothetical protein
MTTTNLESTPETTSPSTPLWQAPWVWSIVLCLATYGIGVAATHAITLQQFLVGSVAIGVVGGLILLAKRFGLRHAGVLKVGSFLFNWLFVAYVIFWIAK